jgi:hypothetical protein
MGPISLKSALLDIPFTVWCSQYGRKRNFDMAGFGGLGFLLFHLPFVLGTAHGTEDVNLFFIPDELFL